MDKTIPSKKDYLFLLGVGLAIVLVLVIASLTNSYTKAKKLCGDPDVIEILKRQTKYYVERNIKFQYGILATVSLDKRKQQQYKEKEKDLIAKIDKAIKSITFSSFKIIKHDDNYKHLICQATAKGTNIKGLPFTDIYTYYVKYYEKDGKNWVYVELKNVKNNK